MSLKRWFQQCTNGTVCSSALAAVMIACSLSVTSGQGKVLKPLMFCFCKVLFCVVMLFIHVLLPLFLTKLPASSLRERKACPAFGCWGEVVVYLSGGFLRIFTTSDIGRACFVNRRLSMMPKITLPIFVLPVHAVIRLRRGLH